MPRPKLNPTEEDRRKVKMHSAVGTPHEEIAKMIGIRSAKTLRKHFRDELDLGKIEANAKVAATLFQMATSRLHPRSTEFWLIHQAGWGRRPTCEEGPISPPPFIVVQEAQVSL